MSLQHTPPGTIRRFAGRCTLALLAAGAFGATLGARAEQAASAPRYSVALAIATSSAPALDLEITADALITETRQLALPRVLTSAGEKFSVSSGEWRVEMSVRPGEAPRDVWLATQIFKSGKLVGEPTIRTRFDEKALVKVGEDGGGQTFSLSMTVTPQS